MAAVQVNSTPPPEEEKKVEDPLRGRSRVALHSDSTSLEITSTDTTYTECKISVQESLNGPGGHQLEKGTDLDLNVSHAGRLKWRVPLDIVFLGVVVLIIWGLLTLPIIYFHTAIEKKEAIDNRTALNSLLNGPSDSSGQPLSYTNNCTVICRENFLCEEESNTCVPNCPLWSDQPANVATAIDILVILFACVGLLGAVGVLVISCIRHKQVFTFPSVFVVYETITILILMVLLLVNYTNREFLYCISGNLLDSIYETSTPFCILSGIVLYYCMLQLNLWWVFHVIALFWKIQFPFHSRSLQFSHHIRNIHIASVLMGLFIPLLPVLATIAHSQLATISEGTPNGLGYGLATFPPLLCYTLNKNVVFYSFILPITLLMVFGITILLVAIWSIHKHHGLFIPKPNKNNSLVSIAEKKLLLVFLYYFLLAVVSYTGFSLFHRKTERYSYELMTYFTCEQTGHDPSKPCDRSHFEKLTYPAATVVSFILVELSPLVNFVFVVNYQDLKSTFKSMFEKNTKT